MTDLALNAGNMMVNQTCLHGLYILLGGGGGGGETSK